MSGFFPRMRSSATTGLGNGPAHNCPVRDLPGDFLGIWAKPVAVALGDLEFLRDEDADLRALTSWTKDQREAMPEHYD